MFETFTKRKERLAKAGKVDVYQYTDLPSAFRVQVVHIWVDAIGQYQSHPQQWEHAAVASHNWWVQLHKLIVRELGVFHLNSPYDDPQTDCVNYILKAPTDRCLDLIELTARWIDRICRNHDFVTQDATSALAELNARFREHAIGFEYVSGEIIQIDSQYVHSEMVKPAIALLQTDGFQGAHQEFMNAHEHYRKGRYKESVTDALKAFESTLRSVAQKKQWAVEKSATSSKLIDAVFTNGLVSPELQSEFTSLKSLLSSGLPTIRNRQSGHGQGESILEMPATVAAFALHLAAANIIFVVSSAS